MVAVLLPLSPTDRAWADEFRLLRFYPPSASAMCLGAAVTGIGDVDGDGMSDVVLSATNRCPEAYFGDWGAVQLISGASGRVIREIQSPDSAAEFGAAVAAIGDIDGDEIADVVIGAPGTTRDGVLGSGRVFTVSTASGQILYEVGYGTGTLRGARFGASVAPVGDLTGDGITDVVVGAPEAKNSNGAASGIAFVISGINGAVVDSIEGSDPGEGFGSRVIGVGDWNGDGDIDMTIGSPTYQAQSGGSGRVFLIDVAHRTVLDTLVAGAEDVVFGSTLAMLGDVDGDGLPDLGVGAPSVGSGQLGHVYAYSRSQTSPVVALTGKPSEQFGSAIASADLDGNGSLDLAVGARRFTGSGGFQAGTVYFHPGYSPASEVVTIGSSSFAALGSSLGVMGDVNGDGRPDLLIGAPGTVDESGEQFGQASVHGYVAVASGRAFIASGGPLRVGRAYRDPRVQLEPVSPGFDLGLLRPETMSLWLANDPTKRITVTGSAPISVQDSDGNGVTEATLDYSSADVASLFDSFGSGIQATTAIIEGDLTDGRRVVAPAQILVDIAPPLQVSVSPNPSRGDAVIAFRTTVTARIRVVLFDVAGRLVGEWSSLETRPAGFQRLSLMDVTRRWERVPTGVYFYSIETGTERKTGRLVIIQ